VELIASVGVSAIGMAAIALALFALRIVLELAQIWFASLRRPRRFKPENDPQLGAQEG
jgi:hypothetical protein